MNIDIESGMNTENRPLILLVDDERFIHDLVIEALKSDYEIMSVEDGSEAIMAIDARPPALILLDVEMPGIDGLSLCRALREMENTANIPVIFLSGHDEITDRIAGYDAGGDDYVIKPFSLRELKAKVARLLSSAIQHQELQNTANFASSTAMTAMSSMGEIGVLLEALKKFNATQDFEKIAEASIGTINEYGLQGAVQVRTPQQSITRNAHGEASPIEIAVINKMIGMDRIFQFGNRLLITYDRVSLLISNLPSEEPDRIGRLRDHLAMLAEGADVRVEAIISAQQSALRGNAINQTLVRITEALKEIDSAQRNGRVRTNMVVSEMSENIGRALLSAALSEEQEDYLTEVIHAGVEKILDTHADDSYLQDKLSSIIHDLKTASGTEASRLMYHLNWSELFAVDNTIIDEDHKTMVVLMNHVYDAISGGSKEQVTRSFAKFVEHTHEHFTREEEMMAHSSYPGINHHKLEHAALAEKLVSFQTEQTQHKDSKPAQAIDALKNWFVTHVVTSDRKLSQHLASKKLD
ncbi:MAG: two component transcriptional regulator, winged helix family [Proteobacteria bacterium]|nr:two component transcriptional regulator, winged helix family [Pseudomonadota bacterium]